MASPVDRKVIEMVSPARKPDQAFSKAEREQVEQIMGQMKREVLPLGKLPLWLQDLVTEISTGVQVRPEMVLSSLLGAIATATQGLCLAKIDQKRIVPLSLFLLVIAISGDGKSQTDHETFSSLKDWVSGRLRAAENQLRDYEARVSGWKAKQRGLESLLAKCAKEGQTEAARAAQKDLSKLAKNPPKKPLVADLFISDATHEALTGKSGLLDFPAATLQTDEGAIFFGGAAFSSSQAATAAMGKYCQLWSNKGFEIRRESTGKMIIKNVALSMCVAAQPVVIDDLFKVRESGWFARALICQLETLQGNRPYQPPSDSEPHTVKFGHRIRELLEQLEDHIGKDRRLTRNLLTLSDEALATWIEYHDDVDRERAAGGRFEFIRAEAARAAENAARIAANLHVYEHGETGHISSTHGSRLCAGGVVLV